jgi:hypothetical protein
MRGRRVRPRQGADRSNTGAPPRPAHAQPGREGATTLRERDQQRERHHPPSGTDGRFGGGRRHHHLSNQHRAVTGFQDSHHKVAGTARLRGGKAQAALEQDGNGHSERTRERKDAKPYGLATTIRLSA